MIVVNIVQPGKGFDLSGAKHEDISQYVSQAKESGHGFIDFISSIIPDSVVGALAKGDLLPILFFAVLFGLAASLGEKASPVIKLFEQLTDIFFKIVNMIMKFSPIAAFGAMAYTIGQFGVGSLVNLGKLMGSIYLTMFLFVFIILGLIAKLFKFNILKFIAYIKEELSLRFRYVFF